MISITQQEARMQGRSRTGSFFILSPYEKKAFKQQLELKLLRSPAKSNFVKRDMELKSLAKWGRLFCSALSLDLSLLPSGWLVGWLVGCSVIGYWVTLADWLTLMCLPIYYVTLRTNRGLSLGRSGDNWRKTSPSGHFISSLFLIFLQSSESIVFHSIGENITFKSFYVNCFGIFTKQWVYCLS